MNGTQIPARKPAGRGLRLSLLAIVAALALAAPASADEYIELTDNGFDPPQLVVDAGEALHFESETGEEWSVTSDAGLFDSKPLAPEAGYSMSLSVPGTHVYRTTRGEEHEGQITVRARSLPGGNDDPAAPQIPDLPFPPVAEGDVKTHPSFGVEASTSRIMLGFRQDATVGEANEALEAADVTIIGGLPATGMLLVEAPDGFSESTAARFANLAEAIDILRSAPGVAYAAMSTVTETRAAPPRPDDATAGAGSGWDWDEPFEKGNWGLVWSQFPEAWNLLEQIRRKQPGVITGIVDGGFEAHEDLPGLQIQPQVCPGGGTCRALENTPNAHGNHVAGIIGAAYDNAADGAPKRSKGVSGANPVARMYGYPAPSAGIDPLRPWRAASLVDQQIELFAQILANRPAQMRVINYSMGAASFDGENWADAYGEQLCGPGAADDDLPELQTPMKQVCTPNNLDEWQREIANAGRAAAPVVRSAAQQGVMIVQAAGNEGDTFCPGGTCQPIDAAARGEFAWVSRHWDDAGVGQDGLANPVFVVQSIENDGTPRHDSTLGGDIAAPGDKILSTVLGDGYASMGGSSMAAPYVTGLIGYLLADDPSLSVADVRRLVLEWANPRPGTGAGADFTWSMPDRTNRDVAGDGMVDYLTDRWEVDPAGYKVDLDACGASVDGKTVATYTWSADGAEIGSTADCHFRWRPEHEGTYAVTLTVTAAGGEQATATKQVKVEDLLIVSVGDSIASGEGNPDVESTFWARWQLERCHRSAFGGPAQAARWLEAADERSSVTLLHLACSGGRIEGDREGTGPDAPLAAGAPGIGGLLTPYEGVTEHSVNSPCAQSRRTDLSACEPPQLDQAVDKLGERRPDALLVSIGANDMWFSTILEDCLIGTSSCVTSQKGGQLFEERIQLLPGRYAKLAAAIEQRWPDLPSENVIITQYPDLTTDETGQVDMSCGLAVGITEVEQQWAHDEVIPRLNARVAQAAAEHGWTLAEGIPQAFVGHGYCSSDPWIVDLTGTFWHHGDKNGAFHPNYAGHTAYAREIISSLRDVLGLQNLTQKRALRDTAPRLNAFRAVAANGPASRVADVNDPSKDGNRRVERTVAADGTVTETEDTKLGHAEGERTAPDGRVDMRDLRRFRDAWLQRCLAEPDGCPAAADIKLDGAEQHPKRDLNLDGCVTGDPAGCGAREHWFSRFDFNGDRAIDPEGEALVPWTFDGKAAQRRADGTRMSDLDVLRAAWSGGAGAEGWAKSDLHDLVHSADLEVHAGAVLDTGASKAEVRVVEKDGGPVGPARTLRRRDGFAVMTVPLNSTTQQFELVTTATTADGVTHSTSEPFSLKYGEDRLVAVCPDITLKASPSRLPARGGAESVITATVHECAGRDDVAGKQVSFELDPAGDGAALEALAEQTDEQGKAQAVFTPGDHDGTYTVKASVVLEEGEEPIEAETEIEVVPAVKIRYVWRQTIEEWHEEGTNRWDPFDPLMPDCTVTGPYCIDHFEIGLASQTLGGVQRAGTLTGGGDDFELTEAISNSAASSASSWNLSWPDGETMDGAGSANWHVSDPDAYSGHEITGLSVDDADDGLRLRGLQAVGDLPYHYSLTGGTTGTTLPLGLHSVRNEYLLIPQGSQKIRFAAEPEEDVTFSRLEEGFKEFTSCGRLEEDLQTQPGYYVSGPSDYIPGAISVGRKPNYEPGDRPMPVGPGSLKIKYAFAATVAYEGQPVADPVLPDCTEDNPPEADFDFTPSGGDVAKEGRDVAFQDRSTDPENDIVERVWDFGDGNGGDGYGVKPHHLFDDDGTYTVSLTVTDAEGNSDTVTKEVEVENEPPEAEIDDVTAKVDEGQITFRMLDPGKVDKGQLHYKLSSPNPLFPTQQGTDKAGVRVLGPITGLPAGTYPLTVEVRDKDDATASDTATLVLTEDAPPPPPPPPATSFPSCDPNVSIDAEEREFLDLVNEYREHNGLAPVGLSATLTKAADRHALDMAAKDYMAHTGKDGSSPAERAWDAGYPRSAGVGENLAETITANDSLWAWRGSLTGHNENMLNPAWRAIGISREKGRIWRWATSYGTVQDCPAAGGAGLRTATKLVETPTKDGVETETVEPQLADSATKTRTAATVGALEEPERTDAVATAAGPAAYPPTAAVAISDARPRAGRPVEVANRSRSAAGAEIAGKVTFGDATGEEAVDIGPGGAGTHTYPNSQYSDNYELELKAGGRAVSRWVEVDPVLPPYLDVLDSDQIAVAGAPYDVEVEAHDRSSWEEIRGMELAFKVGDQVVTATTGPDGIAKATVTLLDTEEQQKIEISFAGDDDFKPVSTEKWLTAKTNHAPVAKPGGPYRAGEGGTLALDGSGSTDEDPSWFDHIASYEWDLDGDGSYDDLEGRLPRLVEGDELDQMVCGGECDEGHDYPIALRVTDSHGKSGTAATTARFVADFDLMLGGGTKTIVPGQSNHFAVTVLGSRSYDKPVTLSVKDLPPGVTASFSKNPVRPTDVSVLTLTGAAVLEDGTFPIKVSGTDGTITKEIGEDLVVAFGLIPVCKGTLTGVIKDKTTGQPIGGADVQITGNWTTTDASGRYVMEQVTLGFNNMPQAYTVTARKDGYWAQTGDATATCGAPGRADIQLLDVRKGKISGQIVDKQTRLPLPDATLHEYNCIGSCSMKKVAEAGDDGRYAHEPQLAAQNTDLSWAGRAEAPGYWYQDKGALVKEGVPVTADYELVKQCSAKLDHGYVRYLGSNAPAPGAGVGVYITSAYTPDVAVQAGQDGRFEVDRTVPLGYNNSATSYKAQVSPPANAPEGTTGSSGYFQVTGCGDEATLTLYLYTPVKNYGAVEGTLTDEETGEPLKDTWVTLSGGSAAIAKTNDEGVYRFDAVHVGNDSQTSAFYEASAEPSGYYKSKLGGTVKKDQTTTLNLKVLKKRYGALKVKVKDSVTGAPVPFGPVYEGSSCFDFCLHTDSAGEGTKANVALGNRNAQISKTLTASASGYWPQSKSAVFKKDETTTVEYSLQPECEPAKVVGTVVNAETQAPIHNAIVSSGLITAFTDVNGRFQIDAIKPATGNNPRQVTLTASAAGFYSQSKTITIFCGAKITLEFGSRTSGTGKIVGTVVDDDTDLPLKDAFVGTDFGATTKTDAEGNYTISNVPLGDLDADREWSVMVHPAAYKPRTKPVTVKANTESRLDFAFSTANEVPVAQGKSIALDEDGSLPVSVTATDADGDPLTYHVMKWPAHGHLSGKLPNVTYVPDDDYNGPDGFEYMVNDGAANSERATVDVTVRPVNDAPAAADDQLDALPDTTTRFPVATLLANDDDDDGEPLEVTAVAKSHADAQVALDGDEVVFTPPPGWAKDTPYVFFQYTVADAAGETDTAMVYVRVQHGPAAPHCVDQAFAVGAGQALEDELACTDANGDALTYTLVSPPAHGTLDLADDGTFTYEPPAGFAGTTTFTFRAGDGELESAVATATITVSEPNAAPACSDAEAQTAEDQPVELTLACTDGDGDAVLYELLGQPAHGTLERLSEGRYRYTPAEDYSGEDGFPFRATDGAEPSAPAAAHIDVTPVNDAPTAADATVTLAEDADAVPFDLAVHAADEETADGQLEFEIVDGPDKGSLGGSGAARTYTPAADANGTDTLTYRVTDRGQPEGTDAKSAESEITFEVEPGNDLPQCADRAIATDEGAAGEVAPSCTDVDGDGLTYEIAGQGAKGAASIAAGKLRYAPAAGKSGADAFTYLARDGHGASAPATVQVTIAAVNAAPIAGDGEVTLAEDSEPVAVDLAALAGDAETPDAELEFEIVDGPDKGSLGGSGAARTYRPAPDENGTDALTYRVTDRGDPVGTGAKSAQGEITFAIDPRNDLPACEAVTLAVDAGEAADVAPSCADVDGDVLTYEIAQQGAKGEASVAAGRLRYAADAGASGADAFTYVARDGGGASAPAEVAVEIAESEQPPPPPPPVTPPPPPVTPPKQPDQGDVKGEQTASDLLLGCAKRPVVLEDIVPAGRRVRLLGVAARDHAGKRVEIRFLATGKVVARPVVGPDGRFAATAPMPARRLRSSNRARYDARIGGDRSPALKLQRRMMVSRVAATGGKVTIAGRVTGPLAKRARDRAIEVRRVRSCAASEVVARIKPGAGGRFRVTVAAPAGERAAVYRLRTRVRRSTASGKLFETFTLPRAVDF